MQATDRDLRFAKALNFKCGRRVPINEKENAMFKNLTGLAQVLKNASSIGERVKEMRESLAATTVDGSAGGGMVQVQVSGLGEVRRLKIAPDLVASNDVEMLEELIPAALNEALTKVRSLHVEKMREATGGVSLPGLDEALANL